MTAKVRPLGVTILTVLQILQGILILVGGLALSIAGLIIPEIFPHVRFFAVRSGLLGVGLVALAVIDFILAYGLWKGKGWAWIATLIFAVLGVAFSVISLFMRPRVGELVSLMLDLVILYYLMQPRIQAYFGRGSQPVSTPLERPKS